VCRRPLLWRRSWEVDTHGVFHLVANVIGTDLGRIDARIIHPRHGGGIFCEVILVQAFFRKKALKSPFCVDFILDLRGNVDNHRQSSATINKAARRGMTDFTKLCVLAGCGNVSINRRVLEHLLRKQTVQTTDVHVDSTLGWSHRVRALKHAWKCFAFRGRRER
jgi:hypothetical protein